MRPRTSEWFVHPEGTYSQAIDEAVRGTHDININWYRPSFVGQGSENIVFELPDHPKVVCKVRYDVVRKIIAYTAERKMPRLLDEGEKLQLKKLVEESREAYRNLRQYFKDMVPMERHMIVSLPVSNELASIAISSYLPTLPPGVYIDAPVRIQEKIPEEALHSSMDIRFDYVEDYDLAEYNRLNGIFNGTLSGAEYLQANMAGTELYEALRANDSLRELVKIFVERAITYAEEKGEILDLEGHNNVLFWQEKGQWKLNIPDGVYPSRRVWEAAKEGFDDFMTTGDLDFSTSSAIWNGINYARFIDALADVTGVKRRLQITKTNISEKSSELLKAMQEFRRIIDV